jgi:hypothetical protein
MPRRGSRWSLIHALAKAYGAARIDAFLREGGGSFEIGPGVLSAYFSRFSLVELQQLVEEFEVGVPKRGRPKYEDHADFEEVLCLMQRGRSERSACAAVARKRRMDIEQFRKRFRRAQTLRSRLSE